MKSDKIIILCINCTYLSTKFDIFKRSNSIIFSALYKTCIRFININILVKCAFFVDFQCIWNEAYSFALFKIKY